MICQDMTIGSYENTRSKTLLNRLPATPPSLGRPVAEEPSKERILQKRELFRRTKSPCGTNRYDSR